MVTEVVVMMVLMVVRTVGMDILVRVVVVTKIVSSKSSSGSPAHAMNSNSFLSTDHRCSHFNPENNSMKKVSFF